MSTRLPVLIVGAGPTGLMMAAALARYHVPCRIVDRLAQPVKTSNALAVQARTLEILHTLGLSERFLAEGQRIQGMNLYAQGKRIAHLELTQLPCAYPFILGIPQSSSERILTEHVQAQGIVIEREVKLTNLQMNEHEVVAQLTHADGREENVTASWLVACDGAHSYVRETLQIPFEGQEINGHFVMIDAVIDAPLSQNEAHSFFTADGVTAILPLRDFARVIIEVSKDPELAQTKKPAVSDFERLLPQRCSVPIKLSKPLWTSGFWVHERLTARYRQQRVFLAGDAAHIHSPVGGQGMNTGLQDANNLAWKLALVIQGKAPEMILESYEQERRPVAQEILKNTTRMTRLVTATNPLLRAVRNVAMKIVGRNPRFVNNLTMQVSELNVHYPKSLLTAERVKGAGAIHPGERAPDWFFSNQSGRFYDLLQNGKAVLMVFTGQQFSVAETEQVHSLMQDINSAYPGLVKTVLVDAVNVSEQDRQKFAMTIDDVEQFAHQAYGVKHAGCYFIRPDGYVGFSGSFSAQAELINYLNLLFVKN